jgi:hypothetical protein
VETIESESGAQRVQRNIRLGDVRQFTKPLAKRALRDHVDKANNYQPQAMKVQMMGKAATLFSVFVERWKQEVLIHKKASSTLGDQQPHKYFAHPGVWKAGDGRCGFGTRSIISKPACGQQKRQDGKEYLDDVADHVEQRRGLEIH